MSHSLRSRGPLFKRWCTARSKLEWNFYSWNFWDQLSSFNLSFSSCLHATLHFIVQVRRRVGDLSVDWLVGIALTVLAFSWQQFSHLTPPAQHSNSSNTPTLHPSNSMRLMLPCNRPRLIIFADFSMFFFQNANINLPRWSYIWLDSLYWRYHSLAALVTVQKG